jgi:hypothetical protein
VTTLRGPRRGGPTRCPERWCGSCSRAAWPRAATRTWPHRTWARRRRPSTAPRDAGSPAFVEALGEAAIGLWVVRDVDRAGPVTARIAAAAPGNPLLEVLADVCAALGGAGPPTPPPPSWSTR